VSKQRFVAEIFEPQPERWGLRGDPVLWAHLAGTLCYLLLPPSPDRLRDMVLRHSLEIELKDGNWQFLLH